MSIFSTSSRAIAGMAAMLFASGAVAHISLLTEQAPVGSSYKAILTVPHGCKGSATTKIRVRVPDGVVGVKPQPKAGWTLETVKGDYTQSYTRWGAKVSSGVQEVIWAGGPLPDDHYDEFVFISYLSDELQPNSTLHFPVVQECEQGLEHWIDQTESGSRPTKYHSDAPAPALQLLPKP